MTTANAHTTVKDIRRENLRRLIQKWRGPLPLSIDLGYANQSFLVQMGGPNPTRDVSEKTARSIEQKLKLPELSMDSDPDAPNKAGTYVRALAGEPKINEQTVFEIVRVVGEAANDQKMVLSPSRFANVVAMTYTDAQSTGKIRSEYITQLLQLLR
jgi:hypothetical protein